MNGLHLIYIPSQYVNSTEFVRLTHSIVRWRNSGLWRISLNKHGQVWKKQIVPSFQNSAGKTATGSSLWFVRSDTPYRKLKDLVGILYDPSKANMVKR